MTQSQDQIISRVRKEGRYSTLTTLTMNMLKEIDREMYHDEIKIAADEGINRQKNYYIIVMRICRIYKYQIEKEQKSPKEAVNYIKKYLLDRYERQVQKKYRDQIKYIQQVKLKIMHDIKVLIKIFECNMESFQDVRSQLQKLYESNCLRQHAKQLKKLTQIVLKYTEISDEKMINQISTNVRQKIIESDLQQQQEIVDTLGQNTMVSNKNQQNQKMDQQFSSEDINFGWTLNSPNMNSLLQPLIEFIETSNNNFANPLEQFDDPEANIGFMFP